MAGAAHHLRVEHTLRGQVRLVANGTDDLSSGCAQQGDSFEKRVSRGTLGNQHEEMLEALNIGRNYLSKLFTQFFVVLHRKLDMRRYITGERVLTISPAVARDLRD